MSDLILFGAGASSGSDHPSLVPPLARNLFDALCTFNPTRWGAVNGGFASQFRTDFEKGMKAFADANPTSVDRLQRAMAAYFFQFRPECSSLYVRLAKAIWDRNWNGALASLNYERLLELALRALGLRVVLGPPEMYTDVEFCLPHGCCHLFGQIRTAGNMVIDRGILFDFPGIRVIENPQEHMAELEQSVVPPVMSYFRPDKQTRAGVSFIDRQRRRFAELVRAAQTVAIIGVTVRPHDTHIWDPLRGTSARIIYCAGKEAGKEFRCWSSDAKRHNDEVLPSYWEEAFDDLCSWVGIA